jgi:hypothetical protein
MHSRDSEENVLEKVDGIDIDKDDPLRRDSSGHETRGTKNNRPKNENASVNYYASNEEVVRPTRDVSLDDEVQRHKRH